jgi:hypothetical protein
VGLLPLAGCKKEQEAPEAGQPVVESARQASEGVEISAENPADSIDVEGMGQEDSGAEPMIASKISDEAKPALEPLPEIDRFEVERFVFKFHRETQDEICGDAEHFIYNGSMMIVGQIQSEVVVEMDAQEFELELITPFDSYILPARQEYESQSGQSRFEQVFVRKGEGAVFVVKGFHTQEDEVVYRDDDDETGTLENFGPVIDAVFDWEKQRYVLSVTRAELIAEDIKRGELLDLSLLMSDFSPEDKDFDQTMEFRYNGEPIDSDNYDYDGDCP